MVDWLSYKGRGPWSFTPGGDKWGYLNNPGWSVDDAQVNYTENPDDEPQVWPCEPRHSDYYNEGSEITHMSNPVWRMDKKQFGEVPVAPATDSEHEPYCGYWPDLTLVPT